MGEVLFRIGFSRGLVGCVWPSLESLPQRSGWKCSYSQMCDGGSECSSSRAGGRIGGAMDGRMIMG